MKGGLSRPSTSRYRPPGPGITSSVSGGWLKIEETGNLWWSLFLLPSRNLVGYLSYKLNSLGDWYIFFIHRFVSFRNFIVLPTWIIVFE